MHFPYVGLHRPPYRAKSRQGVNGRGRWERYVTPQNPPKMAC
jgi:hypothetical protein